MYIFQMYLKKFFFLKRGQLYIINKKIGGQKNIPQMTSEDINLYLLYLNIKNNIKIINNLL